MIDRRRIVGNSLSILVNRLTQSFTTFVLVASIARIRGSYELGQYLLAFSYYYIFMTIASQGFKTLFTRELSRNPLETPVYLVSGTLLQFFFSIIGYIVLLVVVFALPYSSDTSTVCYVMGLTIIPFSLSNVTEAIFQAQEKMHLMAISTVPVYILRVLVMIWAMKLSYGVSVLSLLLVVSETLIVLFEWALVIRTVRPKWQINWDFMWRTVKSVCTFLTIESIGILNSRMQLLILSLLGGEVMVGLYGGITQLIQPFQIISTSLIGAVFPSMSKAAELGREQQRHLLESIIEILLLVALPLTVGLFFIGGDLLLFVYSDPSFEQATITLKIFALILTILSFSLPLSSLFIANGLEWVNLREVIVSTVLGTLLSVPLISQYKLNGAAIAVVLTFMITCGQYLYSLYVRLFYLHLWRIVRRPLLISILMLAIFLILQNLSQELLPTLVAASLVYGVLVSIIGVYAFGGLSVIWDKLLRKS